ncbi:MAG: hypothetical protein WBD34_12410 [Burkholderiaceae bacterium]
MGNRNKWVEKVYLAWFRGVAMPGDPVTGQWCVAQGEVGNFETVLIGDCWMNQVSLAPIRTKYPKTISERIQNEAAAVIMEAARLFANSSTARICRATDTFRKSVDYFHSPAT